VELGVVVIVYELAFGLKAIPFNTGEMEREIAVWGLVAKAAKSVATKGTALGLQLLGSFHSLELGLEDQVIVSARLYWIPNIATHNPN